jgi:hypothetical protein
MRLVILAALGLLLSCGKKENTVITNSVNRCKTITPLQCRTLYSYISHRYVFMCVMSDYSTREVLTIQPVTICE